jgi:hypothetical protein
MVSVLALSGVDRGFESRSSQSKDYTICFWNFYSASSPKQQSAGRQVAPLGHNILIPSQLVFSLSP